VKTNFILPARCSDPRCQRHTPAVAATGANLLPSATDDEWMRNIVASPLAAAQTVLTKVAIAERFLELHGNPLGRQ
jgi:hypothetical protein